MDDNRRPLVLALGNLLREDDAVGLVMLDRLRHDHPELAAAVQFVDGGDGGVALLATMAGRPAMVVLDAVRRGGVAGAVHVLDRDAALDCASAAAPDETGAMPLLAAACLMGDLPEWVRVIGVEPYSVRAGMGLSEPVRHGLRRGLEAAGAAIAEMLEHAAAFATT